jgi:PPOX class probable F420-dependent enzyme
MRRRVTEARVARLATVTPDGGPHLVPVCYVLLAEPSGADVVYTAVDHKPKRSGRLQRIANIEATGRAGLLVDAYDEDWSRLWWIRLDGRGRVVTDPAEATRAVDALVAKYRQYADRRPDGPVIAVDVTRWSGWSGA